MPPRGQGRYNTRHGLVGDSSRNIFWSAQVVTAHFDNAPTGGFHAVVVMVAMRLSNDHFIRHTIRVGQFIHLHWVQPGDTSSNCQHQPSLRARRNVGRLGARNFGDNFTCLVLQFLDTDKGLGSLGHGLDHFGWHQRAAEAGEGAGGVDHRAHAQLCVDIGHIVTFLKILCTKLG